MAEPENAGYGVWLRAAAALTALITAATGLVAVLRPTPTSGKPDEQREKVATASATTKAAPLVAERTVEKPQPSSNAQMKRRTLKWVPSDCAGSVEPSVALDGCTDRHSMDWLREQMDDLRRKKRFGFDALPKGFKLRAADYNGKVNYTLFAEETDDDRAFSVGIGYNRRTNSKDGGLHVYHKGKTVAEAWLLEDWSWAQ